MIFLQSASRLYKSDYSSGDDNMVATIHNDHEQIEPLNMPIKIEIISTTLSADAGSAFRILNAQVVNINPYAI